MNKNKPASPRKTSGLAHKAGHDPRAAALEALSAVIHEGEDSQAALNRVLSREAFSVAPSDKGLCTELVYGALRRYLQLRAFLGRFLAKPDKLPAEMLLLLVQTGYEMAFLRTPHHAGVNWAVNHVRNRFGKGLAGVANGALRSVQRNLAEFHAAAPGGQEQDAGVLAEYYGAPVWLVRLWLESYGAENCRALLEASLCAPPSGLRLNRARQGWQEAREELLRGPQAEAGQQAEAGEGEGPAGPARVLAVGPCGLAFFTPLPWQARQLLKAGRASGQSAASYEALEAFAPQSWPRPVWDCCAGRGGKTLALLEQGLPVGLASDLSARRLSGLGEEYARLGLADPPCPPVLSLDMADAGGLPPEPSLPERFACILVDAPCSGLGTLARRPEIRLRRAPEDLARLAELQTRILDAAWQRLAPGGCIIYLTCTVNPAENEGQTARFLERHAGARCSRQFHTPFDSPLREFFYGARLDKDGDL